MRVADLHCDTVSRIQAGIDLAAPDTGGGHVDIRRLRAGGVGLQAFAAFVSPFTDPRNAFETATEKIDAIIGVCDSNPDDLVLVTDAACAVSATESGRTGALLTVENGYAIEDRLRNLEALRCRGVRSMTLVHSKNTTWAASCTEERCPFDGLTPFGEQVVDAMNEMGMIVDVSHAHESAFWKAAARSRRAGKPFIASHSNAWELCRHPRNLKDDQIREVADQGGVIGINFFSVFLDEDYRRSPSARSSVTIDTVVRHIDHMVSLVGDDFVAFGSDFDGITATPERVTGSDAYPEILARLSERHSAETLEKIAWRNALRVLHAHG